jgi:hypothetical protein
MPVSPGEGWGSDSLESVRIFFVSCKALKNIKIFEV